MADISNDEDIQLVKKYIDGDIWCLEILYNKYKNKLLKVLWYYVYDTQDAEDILQTLFLKLMNSLKKYKLYKDVKFKTWLYRVTANTAKDFLRKKRNDIDINNIGQIKDKYSNMIGKLEENELIKEVQKSVIKLPLKYREVMSLIFFEELQYKEVAIILKKPLGTIKSRMNYALNLLRKKFKVNING